MFLIHGYIEAYLIDWLLIGSTPISKKLTLPLDVIKTIERIGFYKLINIHLVLKNIDKDLYSKAIKLNEVRNDFAHKIIKIDINDKKNKNEIKKIALEGIIICYEIIELYKEFLDERVKKIEKEIKRRKRLKNVRKRKSP